MLKWLKYAAAVLPNLEYANFNRLLVTLGLLGVALAVAIPWLHLRELDVLLVSEAELAGLTPAAADTIEDRQRFHQRAQDWWPLPIAIGATGVALLVAGAVRMFARQRSDDERDDLERRRLAQDLSQQTDHERRAAALSEADAVLRDVEGGTPASESDISQLAERIQQLVEHTASALQPLVGDGKGKILKGVRLGPAGTPIDVVVERPAASGPDLIVETALLVEPRTADVRAGVSLVSEALARYRTLAPAQMVQALIVFAVAPNHANEATIARLRKNAKALVVQRGLDDDVVVAVLPEDNVSWSALADALGGRSGNVAPRRDGVIGSPLE